VMDRDSSINDLGVIMEEKMIFLEHVVSRVFVMLVNQNTVNRVQRSIHPEVSLHVLGSSEAGVHQLYRVEWTQYAAG
jgi:hypothetical protein